VSVKGVNLSGRKLIASKIHNGAALPKLTSLADVLLQLQHVSMEARPTSMIMEAGPFTTSYNLDYEPLQDLLSCLLLDAPDVVILTGPFVIFYLIMLLKTLAVKITASGRILSPILVCRCIPGCCIATWDFATYPCRVYLCMSIFHG